MKLLKNITLSIMFMLMPLSMGLASIAVSADSNGPDKEALDTQFDYGPKWLDNCYTSFSKANKNVVNPGDTTVSATVTVPAGCAGNYSLTSYQTHENRFPLSSQKAYDSKTIFLDTGSTTITVSLPPKGCDFQADLYAGGPVLYNTESMNYYIGHLFSWANGGIKDCLVTPPTPQVTPTPPTTPVTPTAAVTTEQPTQLVNTGPGSIVALFAIAVIGGAIGYRTVVARKVLNR